MNKPQGDAEDRNGSRTERQGTRAYLPFFFSFIMMQFGTHICMQLFFPCIVTFAQFFSRQNFSQLVAVFCAEAANVPRNILIATRATVRMMTSKP